VQYTDWDKSLYGTVTTVFFALPLFPEFPDLPWQCRENKGQQIFEISPASKSEKFKGAKIM